MIQKPLKNDWNAGTWVWGASEREEQLQEKARELQASRHRPDSISFSLQYFPGLLTPFMLKIFHGSCHSDLWYFYKYRNPHATVGWFGQYKMMQRKTLKMTETLPYWYPSESTQRELSTEYQHDRDYMV